jgi:hypothetical protein
MKALNRLKKSKEVTKMSEYRIPVTDEGDNVVGRVRYNSNLDYWDGRNLTCGQTGRHKGIAKLKDGRFVIIHGTQWQGEKDSAHIISDEEALQEILKSGNTELLSLKKYHPLKELQDETIMDEEDEVEEELQKS